MGYITLNVRRAITDFLAYFGSFYSYEVLTTYAHILYALYLVDITLKIRNFIMLLFVDLYKILCMQLIGMSTDCL